MSDMPYKLDELNPDEAKALTKELQDVLAKYDCEIGIQSQMTIMKRVPATPGEPILSPIQPNGDNGTDKGEAAQAN